MTTDPDEIRSDIERTRTEVGSDVDALAEKVNPTKAVGRQTDKVRERLGGMRDAVMGSPDDRDGSTLDDVKNKAGDWANQAGQAVQGAPDQVTRKTRGNPLAAGLIALGVGWLVGSLLPASKTEQGLATSLKEQAQPVVDEAKNAAKEAADNLKPQAQDAVESVKQTATEGAQQVRDEGQQHAQNLSDQSQRAAQHVKDDAQNS